MPQIFPRSSNDYARLSIIGALVLLAGLVWGGALMHKSGYRTGEGVFLHQPVPFSHEHHVRSLGIDCRYCHTSVETSSSAGIPPVATCMNCHRQIWTNAGMLEPVREAWRTGVPIQWERVHDLPDFVYFNHSVHVAKGIGCSECHGRIDQMPLTLQVASLDMQWCLDCHRDPAGRVRPKDKVFEMDWDPREPTLADLREAGMSPDELGGGHGDGSHAEDGGATPAQHGGEGGHGAGEPGHPEAGLQLTRTEMREFQERLAEKYEVESLMSCSVCHR